MDGSCMQLLDSDIYLLASFIDLCVFLFLTRQGRQKEEEAKEGKWKHPSIQPPSAAAPRGFPGTGLVRCTHPGHLTSGPASATTASLHPDTAAVTTTTATPDTPLLLPASRS